MARIGTGTKDTTTFYRGDGTFQVVSTDLVGDTSPQLGGDLDTNSHNISLDDDHKVKFGDSDDLQIYHSGSHAFLKNFTGSSYLDTTGNFYVRNNAGNSTYMYASGNEVALYYTGTKRFETTNTGVTVSGSLFTMTGAMGSTENFTISNTTSGGYIQMGLQQQDTDGLHHRAYIKAYKGTGSIAGKLELLARGSGGGTNRGLFIDSGGVIESSLSFNPLADNTYDLGSSSRRWRNVYTADLHCSNRGSKNDVDGTWGDYTMQEGENDLFLINNRNGKKYKFNLTEVS